MGRARMHQTTVRFTADLWEALEREASRAGVSAAQYVRDATFARLAHAAGRRGEPFFGGGVPAAPASTSVTAAAEGARDVRESSTAVWAQAQLARERARAVRGDARATQIRTSQGRAGRGDETVIRFDR